MGKVVLVLEYDGSRYHGFQYQENAPTIQAEVERAIARLTGEPVRVVAASRTDAGVHARGQVLSFRTRASHPPAVWVKGLNFYLPQDIAVRQAYLVEDSFDVRRGAVSREYRYFVLNRLSRSPLKRRFALFYPHPLDVEAMDRCCQGLVGERDFTPFSPLPMRRPVRTMFRAGVERKGQMVVFRLEANSFLPHQVRHTVGALLRVGGGRMGLAEFQSLSSSRTPGLAGPALAPHGLFLMKVNYPQSLGAAG